MLWIFWIVGLVLFLASGGLILAFRIVGKTILLVLGLVLVLPLVILIVIAVLSGLILSAIF